MKIFAALLLISVFGFAQDKDREKAPTDSLCSQTSFVGDVKLGLPFSQTIGSGLTYRLLPSAQKSSSPAEKPTFTGWTIQFVYLGNRGDMEREFSEIVTPPFREAGPRQIDAATEEKAERADHTINFVTNTFDFAEANKVLRPIMWRSSPPEVQEAVRELQHIQIGTAKLTITRQQLAPDSKSIQSLSFKVDLYVPSTVKLAPELASRARTVPCPASKLTQLFHEIQQ
jgi:hypothetical protein